MRKKFNITTFGMLQIAVVIYGLISLASGYFGSMMKSKGLDFREFSAETLDDGIVAEGVITDCLKRPVENSKLDIFSGEDTLLIVKYQCVTIPVNGQYIRFWACNSDTIKKLESTLAGEKVSVPVRGRVEKVSSPDLTWYDGIENFDKTQILSEYVIREDSKLMEKAKSIGSGLLVLFGLLFIKFGGVIENRYESMLEDRTDHSNLENVEREIRYIRECLDKMYSAEKKLILETLFGVVLLVGGTAYLIFGAPVSLVGWILICVGLKKAWSGFINSDHGAAINLADRLNISTLQTRKDMYERFARDLENLVRKEKEKNELLQRLR